jgi:uncharacterized protein
MLSQRRKTTLDCRTLVEVYAPNDLNEIWNGELRINPLNDARPDLFLRKAESYKRRWPFLAIIQQ